MATSNEINTLNALESLNPRKVYVEDLYTTKNRFNTEKITNVYRSIAVPLFLNGDKDSPYEVGAVSFDKFKQTIKPNAIGFFFQFMLLFVENIKDYGGICSKLKYTSKLYPKLVHLLALRVTGKQLNDSQKTFIKNYTTRDEYEDLQLTHDVKMEVEYVMWVTGILNRRKGKKPGKLKEGAEEEEAGKEKKKILSEQEYFSYYYACVDEVMEEEEELVARRDDDEATSHAPAAVTDSFEQVRASKTFLTGGGDTYFAFRYSGPTGNILENSQVLKQFDVTSYYPEPAAVAAQQPREPVVRSAVAVPAGPRVNQLDHSKMKNDEGKSFGKYTGYDKNKPQRVPKAVFCWSVIPDRSGNPAVAIAQVVILTNEINIGFFQQHLIENNERRLARINNGGKSTHWDAKSEMFPSYTQYYYRGHHPTNNNVNKQTFVNCIKEYAPEVFQRVGESDTNLFYDRMDLINDGDTHLYRVLSLQNAIAYCIAKQNANPNYNLDMGYLDTGKWMTDNNTVCTFPAPTWKPAWIATMWFHQSYVGLCQKYMFHVDMKTDFLKSLCNNSTGGAHQPSESELNSLEKLLAETPLISISKVMDNKLIKYETSNQMIHATSERDVIYNKLKQHVKSHFLDTFKEVLDLQKRYTVKNWRNILFSSEGNEDLKRRIGEMENYNNLLGTTQNALLNKFRSLWPIAGGVDDLNISDTMKTVAKWYQENKAKGNLPHLTREFVIWDPEIDFFGNTQIQHLSLYIYFQRVLQPLICLMSEGLFSAYDAKMDEMSFCQIVHGRYDTGKTFTAIKTLIDFTCIPGTVSEFSLATKAADVTRKHCYDEIIASDECPNWLISEKEAEKFPEQVNKAKISATRGQLTQRTFAFITLPNGEKIRWNEDIVTDHKKSYVYVTNLAAESKRALSSRMHRVTMKQCKVPANEMVGHMDATLKSDAKMWLHINQYLSMCVRKGMSVGTILPEVNLDLFDKVSNLALHYLREWGCIEDSGARPMDIIRPYMRQLVIKHAIRMAFDMPFSPCYKKEFDPSFVREVQQYLYCTWAMIWFAMTACVSEYIEDDNSIVIKAMMKLAGIDWQEGDTAYGLFERDVNNVIKFKTVANPNYTGDMLKGDDVLLDINYVSLDGDENTLANQIAIHTVPRLDANSVKAVMRQLTEHLILPENGGYVPQEKQTFETWHKYTVLPTRSNKKGVKKKGNDCPPKYNTKGDADRNNRSIQDMPCGGSANENRIPVIEISKSGGVNKICFCPGAVNGFRQNAMRTAMQAACFNGFTRPAKIVEGIPNVQDPAQLSHFTFEQDDIDEYCYMFDRANGYGKDPLTGEWVYLEDPHNRRPKLRPVSRKKEGIAFNLQAALGEKDVEILKAQPFAPKPEGSDWKTKYEDGTKSMKKTREIIQDLDFYSAMQQHIACGKSFDEPVRDPVWIKEQYKKKVPESTWLNFDYPHDLVKEKEEMKKVWRASFGKQKEKEEKRNAVKNAIFSSYTKIATQKSSMSREERKRLKESQTTEINRNERDDEEDEPEGDIVDVTRSSTLPGRHPAIYSTPKKRTKTTTAKSKQPPPGVGLSAPMHHPAVSPTGSPRGLPRGAPREAPMGPGTGPRSPTLVVAPLEYQPTPAELAKRALMHNKKRN